MWIILKLVVTSLAFVFRLYSRKIKKTLLKSSEVVEDQNIFIDLLRDKHSVVSTFFHFEYTSSALFKLTSESEFDHFFKKMGLSSEIQTGDFEFDKSIYIASDHSAFREQITNDLPIRSRILELFKLGCDSIQCNGALLTITFPLDKSMDLELKKLVALFFKQFSSLEKLTKNSLQDPFALKVLFVECLIWSIAGYSWSSYLTWTFSLTENHLKQTSLILKGILIGIVFTTVLVLFVARFFKGSSRGHRIIIESAFVLLISLPIGGIGIFHDLNVGLDNFASVSIESEVLKLEERIHRKRSHRAKKSYHLEIKQVSNLNDYLLKTNWKISLEQFQKIGKSKHVIFKIRPGFLNESWIESIEQHTASADF